MRNVTKTLRTLMLFAVSMFVFVSFGFAQQTMLLTESFETASGTTPPAGWALEQVTGTTLGVNFVTTSTYPTISAAYDGTKFVQYNSFNISSGSTRLKRTAAVSTTNHSFVMVDFAWYEDPGYSSSADKVDVQWSTNGTTWNTAGTFLRYNAVAGWKSKNVVLPTGANNQATLYVAFLFTTAYGNNCAMDLVHVTAGPPAPPAFATIGTGTVSSNYPYTTYWMGGRTQMLYTAAELTAAGVAAGNLSSVGFNVISNSTQIMNGFNVKIGATALTTLSGGYVNGLTSYYTTPYTVPGPGWQDINLTTPFVWNGTSNVIVEICYANTSYTTYSPVNATTMSGMTAGHYADNQTECTVATNNAPTARPNIRIGIPPITPGVLMGYVRNVNTLAPIAGAIVVVGTKRDTSRANGMYIIYNLAPGAVTANCTAAGYIAGSVNATITSGAVTNQDILMAPGPKVGGTVTDASTGAPITGATVTVGTGANAVTTLTIAGGTYLTPLLSIQGAQPIVIGKTGYDDFTGTVTLVPNTTATQDAALLPTAVQPGPFTAVLNATPATAVNLNWGVPQGMYQLIYDDGTQDNFAIWANANNLNALKFTPLAWPVKLIGGKVNLGTAANYPANVLPFAKFKMFAYKADGAGGVPGTIIDSVEITPTDFGWVNFSFSAPLTINSGDFYLVMKQGGIPPHAAGVGVDLTNSQLRSWSKFVTGGAPWVPAAGNFMMRAIVQGTGGPMLGDNPVASREEITATAVNGLIYETPVASVTGFEGTARTEPFDWSTMQNTNSAAQFTLTPVVQDASETGVGTTVSGTVIPGDAPAVVLFDNGPLVNSTGTGAGGADESVIQAPLNSYGWNFNKAAFYRMADDFTVSGTPWNVSSVEFYGYQTNSPTTSTFTGAYLRILNGVPGAPGTSVVWGDTVTNVMTSTAFTNIYRTNAINGGVARPIMKIVVNTPGLTLPPGTYYVDFCATGSLASGPWCPPVTINNTPVTGNALVYGGTVAGYQPLMGGATATYAQGVPFKISGTQATPSSMSYQVWRLLQGQEGTQSAWTSIWTGNINSTVDNSWPTLPNGAYRWAVKAIYSPPGQRPSAPTFSNVIGKNWIANVNVCVSLTCAANPKAGSIVKLTNTAYPDTNYTKTTDTSGCVHFTNVWKGTYNLQVIRFTYPVYTQTVTILGDASYNVMLLQDAAPPTNLAVNDQSLRATWSPPRAVVYQLNETFTTGGFTTNQWVVSGGTNWQMSTGTGNPAPSAFFNWTPQVQNYDQYLTSKSLAGLHAPQMKLKYDIFLDNYGTTNLNTMAVELWNGTAWTVLKTYDNSSGQNIPWTSETLDISSQTHNPAFKVRFHAAGVNSVDIDGWYIDNVQVMSTDGTVGPNPCVIGYNFYLNNVLSAFTADTTYNIPPNQVVYGVNYQACVKAVYGSGYSPQICVNFTSHFLYPARDLTATAIECNAYLSWKKPITMMNGSSDAPAFTGVVEHSASKVGRAPASNAAVAPATSDAPLGSNAFGINMSTYSTINFDVNNVGGATTIAALPNTSDFWHDMEFPANTTDYAYAIKDGSDHLYKVIRATGAFTDLGSMGVTAGQTLLDIAVDGSNGDMYGVSSDASLAVDMLWKINPSVPNATLVGNTVNSKGMISLAGDQLGNIWGYDLVNDNFFSLNKTTGVATVVGPLGFDANYGQCMFYDQAVNTVTMAAYNNSAGQGQIRAVNTATGASTLMSSTANQIGGATLPVVTSGGGGGTPAGLIGYNIYRGGNFIHYNPHQDSITYYDYGLNPGTYKYDVKAKYDLGAYGFPGQFGESLTNTAGEQTVTLNCGTPLPFYEPWDAGTFGFNNWSPAAHWTMNTGIGNPAPCADFTWSPAAANYSYALVSEVIDASAWTCAAIWLDFDLKLIDRNNTGKEKLTIDLFYGNSWHQKLEVSNNGSTNWVAKHIDISAVKGKSFRIRFVANGVNSADLLHWYVDNIHAYGICKAPTGLTKTQSQFTTTLTWTAPNCGGAAGTIMNFIFDDGTAESGVTDNGEVAWLGTEFPISAAYDGVLKEFKIYWMANASGAPFTMKVDVYDAAHTLLGSSANFQIPSDDWVTVSAADIPFSGPFFAMVKWDNNPSQTNYLGFDNDGPNSALNLGWYRDAAGVWAKINTLLPTIGSGCFMIQAKALVGADKKEVILGQAAQVAPGAAVPANHLTSIKRNVDTHYYGVMGIETDEADSSTLSGYNVYRTAATGVAPYAKLNASPVTGTTYVDTYPTTLVSGTFKYYVTSLYKNSADNTILCESSSDTITVTFPAVGMNELTSVQIMVYPNPANEIVNIKSDYTITGVEVMNFVGQTVATSSNVDAKTTRLDVTTYKPGVYFVKVSTLEGIRTVKITVTH